VHWLAIVSLDGQAQRLADEEVAAILVYGGRIDGLELKAEE
jgi:hypothetical protein